jgi:hypothetical protein
MINRGDHTILYFIYELPLNLELYKCKNCHQKYSTYEDSSVFLRNDGHAHQRP